MRRIPILFFIALLTVGLFSSCTKNNPGEVTPKSLVLTAEAPQAISSSNQFGIELFTRVAESDNQNLMLSPLSASVALTMLLNGCDGDTYRQLKEMLCYPDGLSISDINEAYKSLVRQLLEADPKVKLSIANAIFYKNGFNVKPPFLATMSNDFDATVSALDFGSPSALNTVNKWASANTSGKIPKVLDEIDPGLVMLIMNALYFNGDWSHKFDKSLTEPRPFYPDGGSMYNVSTMSGEPGSKISVGAGYRAIELPYGRTNFTMVVVVPDKTLAEFYPSFTPQLWEQLTSDLDAVVEYGKWEVLMPKFKFEYDKVLNDQLMAMGMVDAFNPFKADLSGIAGNDLDNIYVSFVKQNTFVDVDERGTEAAAVTTIGIGMTSSGPPSRFIIDKSFIFGIRERTTNTLLFIGQVISPGN